MCRSLVFRTVVLIGLSLVISTFGFALTSTLEDGTEIVQPENDVIIEVSEDFTVEELEPEPDVTYFNDVGVSVRTTEDQENTVKLREVDSELDPVSEDAIETVELLTMTFEDDEFDDSWDEVQLEVFYPESVFGVEDRYSVIDADSGEELEEEFFDQSLSFDVPESGTYEIRYIATHERQTGFEDDAVRVMTTDGATETFYNVNEDEENFEFQLEADFDLGETRFESTEDEAVSYELEEHGTQRSLIHVDPEEAGQGEIEVTVENADWGAVQTYSKPVIVRESAAGQQREVTGIGSVQILWVLLLVTILFAFALP